MLGNVVVGQSGGPTAVINSSVAGVYVQAKKMGAPKVFGMVHGIEGFLDGKLCDLDNYLSDSIGIELLRRTPSAFLGTCRYKMPPIEGHEDVYEKIIQVMEENDIEVMFYIGGNDSMDTVKMLSDYATSKGKKQRFIGVPKTIDNDLPITDHCPGYGSAAKYIATSLKEIIRDNESFGAKKPTVVVVEIMGRHAGWLTAAAALAKSEDCTGVDAIYLPEVDFDFDAFMAKVEELAATRHSVVIAVSEGIHLADGTFVCEVGSGDAAVDAFGHKQLSGSASYLARMIAGKTGLKTRAIEFSTLQRAASHIASKTDADDAYHSGRAAVNAAAEGKTGDMVVLKRISSDPYLCGTDIYDIHEIANVERKVPVEWITEDGCGLKQAFIDYARPLIQGEILPVFVDGTPRHLVMKELFD